MKTLYLHVGPHKTGTTLLQKFMLDNTPALAEQGLVYPSNYIKIFGHHELRQKIVDRALSDEDVQFINQSTQNILFSSEDFISLNKADFEYLRDVIDNKNIVVIYAWRRAGYKMYSIWQEVIKHGGTETFYHYFHNHLARPGQSQMLSADLKLAMFQSVFGEDNLIIIDYDSADSRDSLVKDFLQAVNITWYPSFVIANDNVNAVNKSMPVVDIEIIRALNFIFAKNHQKTGSWVRTKFVQEESALLNHGLTELRNVIKADLEKINVGNYFIDHRCEKIMVTQFANVIQNYQIANDVRTIELASSDWMLNPEAQKYLANITQHLTTFLPV
ncbi:MAG: hypothetical protein GW763_00125 [Paraglaciecola sp.]|nr:hypothetical protein [Paraglaciecola sp.]NCT46402.1 hypothetical protein [Paraglaciecola sp.]